MKTLASDEIEALLGVRPLHEHPLEILGYGFTSEGMRRFRAERPNFLPQLEAYVQSVLARAGVFPEGTERENPGTRTFIYRDGASFKLSSVEEVGLGRYERFSTGPLSAIEAVHAFIRRVANPDYVHA